MRRELLVGFLLVAAVAVVYWPVHSYPFVLLDDPGYVSENPFVRNGLTCEGVVHAFRSIAVGNWHPVTMLSRMLDCQLFGAEEGRAGTTRSTSLLHAANTVLLFIVLGRMTGPLARRLVAAFSDCIRCTSNRSPGSRNARTSSARYSSCSSSWPITTMSVGRRSSATRRCSCLGLGGDVQTDVGDHALGTLALDYWPLGRGGPGSTARRWERMNA